MTRRSGHAVLLRTVKREKKKRALTDQALGTEPLRWHTRGRWNSRTGQPPQKASAKQRAGM